MLWGVMLCGARLCGCQTMSCSRNLWKWKVLGNLFLQLSQRVTKTIPCKSRAGSSLTTLHFSTGTFCSLQAIVVMPGQFLTLSVVTGRQDDNHNNQKKHTHPRCAEKIYLVWVPWPSSVEDEFVFQDVSCLKASLLIHWLKDSEEFPFPCLRIYHTHRVIAKWIEKRFFSFCEHNAPLFKL